MQDTKRTPPGYQHPKGEHVYTHIEAAGWFVGSTSATIAEQHPG